MPVKVAENRWDPVGAGLTLVLALALPLEKAKSMVTTLLKLGATSAQGDTEGVTAFHKFVQADVESLVDVLRDDDKTGFKAALNHIAFTSYQNKPEAPIQAAVENGNLDLVLKLLDSGALAEIDFETWLKSAKQFIKSRLHTYEQNKILYQTTVQQPLILALQSANPAIALELIERGADVNSMTTRAYSKITSRYSYYNGESALDLVRSSLGKLGKYKGEGKLAEPRWPQNMTEFLQKFEPGTYAHYMVSKDIEDVQMKYRRNRFLYDGEQNKIASRLGVQEKTEAIQNLIDVLKKIEQLLLEKGAKTFKELHPDTKDNDHLTFLRNVPEIFDFEYNFDFTFGSVTDVTEARRAAYIKL